MHVLAALAAVVLVVSVLWDAFQTIILPRRVRGKIRLTRAFYRLIWTPWSAVARRLHNARRENFLSYFGPLALILLLAVWAVGLVVGFALWEWALGTPLADPLRHPGFGDDLYFSGTTFFTLGLGDIVPLSSMARLFAVIEAGVGFAFLALVIGYLPILYQTFSRREVDVSLLDARAGSPPSAAELLRRHGPGCPSEALPQVLRDWEHWSAELLEGHLSYPSLAYFRSQHDNQSWLSALTVVLDATALLLTGVEGMPEYQARLTFAIARHAAVDLSQVFNADPKKTKVDRLPLAELTRLRAYLAEAGAPLRDGTDADKKLAHLRHMYEPYVAALSQLLFMELPPWLPVPGAIDDWQSSPTE